VTALVTSILGPLRHSCFRKPDSILEKLRTFHHAHQAALDVLQADLEAAVEQLPDDCQIPGVKATSS
jgi:hypothetical protein